jgi:hypothetical protein
MHSHVNADGTFLRSVTVTKQEPSYKCLGFVDKGQRKQNVHIGGPSDRHLIL